MLLPNWLDADYVESFFVALVNRGSMLIGISKISIGSVSGTVADPVKIFQTAIKANASGVMPPIIHRDSDNLTREIRKSRINVCRRENSWTCW